MDVINLVKHLRNRERARRCSCAANISEPRGRHDFTFCAYCQGERHRERNRIVSGKVCPKCPEKGEQPKTAFVIRTRNDKQSLSSWCRECTSSYRKAYSKEYYAARRRKEIERRKAARAREQERINKLAYAQTSAANPRIPVSPPRYCKVTGRVLHSRS